VVGERIIRKCCDEITYSFEGKSLKELFAKAFFENVTKIQCMAYVFSRRLTVNLGGWAKA